MSRYHSYINSAAEIIKQYKGEEPLSSFLKKYFAQHKKFGSKDRKQVSHLCYCYYRLGKALPLLPVTEKVITSLFLCSSSESNMLESVKPEWNQLASLPFQQKLNYLPDVITPADIFPFVNEVSSEADKNDFAFSFFTQPDLFLRLRPGYQEIVKNKLAKADLPFTIVNENCLALANNSKVDEVVTLNKEAVVQDYSSQRVGELLQVVTKETQGQKITVWDCCAASGGKSILAYDLLGNIELTVTDIRESILANLKKRLSLAGIIVYKAAVMDLSKERINNSSYQLIICDAPCTGSGTWARTPEQLFYFEEKRIEEYAALQKSIAANALTSLQAGGYFLYITCSVFKKENEEVVETILKNSFVELVQQEIFVGYHHKADSMFAALFKRK